ncbi:MAG: XTP/dITP diphosphatase [Alphaproteobacteria bacterium]|nr:XTP/dITP diphosphatase [Alphaproteobacteria bacterium]
MKLVVATRNKHKMEEIRAIFIQPDIELVCALDYPNVPDLVEDGDTFEANAIKKAATLAKATGLWSLADDSGLEVDALNGAPGIYSARYAGEPISYPSNNRKLLDELEKTSNRRARFRCVIALSSPSGRAKTLDGCCEGIIACEESGRWGFGYDPLFIPDGFSQTFAELDPETKNAISHRGRALKKAREEWGIMLASGPTDWP